MRLSRFPPRLLSTTRRARPLLIPGVTALLCVGSVAHSLPRLVSVRLTGTVRDAESGVPVADAIVSLTGLNRTVLSDEKGRYTIDTLPGRQHVTVQRLGYEPREFDALVPSRGFLEVNVELRCVPIELGPVEVRSRVPVRGLGDAAGVDFPDRSIGQAELYHHPLLAEPDVLRGIAGGEVVLEPESPSGIHVRGGASDQLAYLIDGIPVFNPYHSAGTFSAWNPDALASVALVTTSAVPTAPAVLSGVVSARTHTPGPAFHTRGSMSATQARATIDGPAGPVGYLVSVSSAFPGLAAHKREASQVGGENFDWLGKVESPLLGGRLRVLGYASQTEIDASVSVETGDSVVIDSTRNTFQWVSRSLGAEWVRPIGGASLVLRSWTASGTADAEWTGTPSRELVTSRRRNDGLLVAVELPLAGGRTNTGVRIERSRTSYRFRSSAGDALALDVDTPLSTLFLEHGRSVTARGSIDLAVSGARVGKRVYSSPSLQLRWRAARSLVVSATAARRHQFGQSLRNPESIVSNIFPADLYVGAGDSGVPVSSSNIGIVALEYRPNERLRVACQMFARDFNGLALVAPRNSAPFATDGFAAGLGDAHGVAVEGALSGGRYGIIGSYGYQRIELSYADGTYVPGYGAVHSVAAGVVVLPAPTYSLKIAFESVLGRRATSTLGAFEWEACNLLDQGCEFAGSPAGSSEALGATALPAYYRLDVGVRKSWHLRLGGRDGLVAVFGTVTNLLGRRNVLTVAVDPSTSEDNPIEMRPFSPLVVGLDWRF